LSYAELEHRARVLARAIVGALGRPAERVGVFASRSEAAYAGTLGALFSGAAFVPLNRKFPVERSRSMARQARLDAIIVDRQSAPDLAAVLDDIGYTPLIVVADPDVAVQAPGCQVIDAAQLATMEPLDALPAVLIDDLAYLLFTSGTTGEPKGVGVTHANALHYLDVMGARYGLTGDDRCSQTFDQTFDLAVHDLFMTWNAGACLYAMQPIELLAPTRFVAKHEITCWFSVPSAPALALKKNLLKPGSMPSLRLSLFCGEPLPATTAAVWQAAAPSSVVENIYGPTELTIACFAYRWDSDTSPAESVNGIVSIGQPLPGLGAIVVDDACARVADGEVGELLVCGPQTTPGYWLDERKTAERFVEVPVSETRRKRFYRTGDRVIRQPTGNYTYIGRVDHQIKVLGFRVELAEVEAALLRQPGVAQAVAIGWPVEDGRALGIVGFVLGQAASSDAMRQALATMLPDYMVPSRVVQVDEFPLNANGKVDRKQLAEQLAPVAALGA
jgi:amino acid adenylation domain-containing protein